MVFSKISLMISIALTTFGLAEQKKSKVVVIGAGLAGLTTAYRLQQKGIEVEVYEARNRVGGRIFTARMGNHEVELGGQNITDGGEAENIGQFIEEFQLELIKNRMTLNYHYFNGESFIPGLLLNRKEFNPENLKLQLAQVAQKSQNMQEVLNVLFEKEDPLCKILSVMLAAYEGASPEKLSPIYTDVLYHMLLGGICSTHAQNQEETHLDIISIKGGNALLPKRLAQSLKVHLNSPLVAVSKTLDNSYELVFQNGQKVKTDLLVLAIPCTVYNDIAFEENLIPKNRLESIRNIQYGTNAKILVPFSQQPSEAFTFINNCIGSFFANRKILTLYCVGDTGKFSESTILNVYQQEHLMLEKGFGALCPPLLVPTYVQDEFLPSYVGPIGYSWSNDPYAKGSYSYIAPGQESILTLLQNEEEERVKALFAPINQTLYFAGEHASILIEVPGTMEAACESGERTARMIAKSLEKISTLNIRQ